MQFSDLITNDKILSVLTELGFQTPTPIQEKAIPEILKGSDLRASAETGTGKTAAFLLPTLMRLASDTSAKGPRALILAPTRELAMQLSREATKLGKGLGLVTVCLFGGVPYPVQNKQLSSKHDILIATPGRLIDHMDRKRLNLKTIEIFILDEADRMLDMGFIEPVETIAARLPAGKQTLMFSATFDKKIQKLSETLLTNPVEIKTDARSHNHDTIEQKLHRTNSLDEKHRILDEILSEPALDQAIVFSATKRQTEILADELCDRGFKAAALHGDMSQRERTRTIHQLREGKIRILVATDVAARGIDILTISHVINFDLPNTLDDYIHRIGRTGRAGGKGVAFSFISHKDYQMGREIEKFSGLALTPDTSAPRHKRSHHKGPRRNNFPRRRFPARSRP